MTLQTYYDQVVAELIQRNIDFHIGAAQRKVIANCHKNGKSIREAADIIEGVL